MTSANLLGRLGVWDEPANLDELEAEGLDLCEDAEQRSPQVRIMVDIVSAAPGHIDRIAQE